MSNLKPLNILPPIGSTLPFPNSSDVAILKYVGSVSGHDGVFCGLELCGSISTKGKNNGSVNGISYFEVNIPNSGLFVPLRKVIGWLNINNNENKYSNENYSNSNLSSPATNVDNFKQQNNEDIHELRRHINILEKRLVQRENDMKELDIQLDELDANLKANDARLIRKEERFNRYRDDKENEISLLVSTIESLEKKVDDAENKYLVKIKEFENNQIVKFEDKERDEMKQKILNLEKELKDQKEIYQTFKTSKIKEINELRKLEMENYKINEELERLKEENKDSIKLVELERKNEEYIQSIENYKLDIELRDNKIENLEKIVKDITRENENLKHKIEDFENNSKVKDNLIDENGGLKVYMPTDEIDPSAGKANFCTFCDKEGHDTSECPFEKDNIEMF